MKNDVPVKKCQTCMHWRDDGLVRVRCESVGPDGCYKWEDEEHPYLHVGDEVIDQNNFFPKGPAIVKKIYSGEHRGIVRLQYPNKRDLDWAFADRCQKISDLGK